MAIPILWRNRNARYSLQGEKCPECERVVFPPRRLCPYCGRDAEAHNQWGEPDEPVLRREFIFRLPRAVELAAVGDD